jgi:TolA-binding protein
MNAKVKLASYAVLIILAAAFAWGFYSSYSAVSREAAATGNEAPPVTTNGTTNSAASTNQATSTAPPASAPPAHSAHGRMIAYLAAMVLALIGLGIMIAYDFTQIIGSAAVDALLDDRGEGMRDPAYERAEQAWANGKFLEAIQMMRDFLKDNPREQYAALRIAEIYEKDLHNLLAAALEYEEVLKKKLPAERWGWAAVHLCNLYSKLGQQDKTRALLQRIVDEYPKTGAAKKARSRLGLPEPEPEPVEKAATTETDDETGEEIVAPAPLPAAEPRAPEPPPPLPPPKSNLPPGFRPK